MNKYIGFKLIEAEFIPKNQIFEKGKYGKDGYKVKYPDGYVSWSPKDVFEKAYLKVTPNPKLKSNVSISQNMVDEFIKDVQVSTIGDKTTLVRVTLVNGFEIVESSACVDKENYSEEIGGEVCLKKVKDKIWYLLGFLLQTAVGGIK
jgi:hypothetical protein